MVLCSSNNHYNMTHLTKWLWVWVQLQSIMTTPIVFTLNHEEISLYVVLLTLLVTWIWWLLRNLTSIKLYFPKCVLDGFCVFFSEILFACCLFYLFRFCMDLNFASCGFRKQINIKLFVLMKRLKHCFFIL